MLNNPISFISKIKIKNNIKLNILCSYKQYKPIFLNEK